MSAAMQRSGARARAGTHAASKVFSGKGSARKLPCTTVHCCASPAFSLCPRARLTWYSLMVMPVTCAPVAAAMVRIGPPTPQPQSIAFMPALRSIALAMFTS